MYKFGKRSRKRLEGIEPELRFILNELIKIMDVTIIEGVRSQERQNELVAKGASKTKYSKHIDGRAVDLAPYPIDWDDRDTFHYMCGMIRGIAHVMKIPIRVGCDWDSDGQTKDNNFDDLVHMELKS